jgi:hypothetical protein
VLEQQDDEYEFVLGVGLFAGTPRTSLCVGIW